MRKNPLPTSTDSDPLLLPRRQFLVLGSTAVAVAAASSLSADIVRGALVIEDKAPRLSLGFVDANIADFTAPEFTARVKPAADIGSGDSSLADGVRMKIHGLVRPETRAEEPASMGLDVMYRVNGLREDVPFMAWSYGRVGHQTLAGAEKDFVVPINARQPLSLVVSTSANTAALKSAKLQGAVSLSLADGRANKLRTGLYFIAVCPAGTKEPDWSSVRAVPSEKGKPVLRQAGLGGLEPVSFDYIIVSTSRA